MMPRKEWEAQADAAGPDCHVGYQQRLRADPSPGGVRGLCLRSVAAPAAPGRRLRLCCLSGDVCCRGAERGVEGWSGGAFRSGPASPGEEKARAMSAEPVAGREVQGREGVLLGTALTFLKGRAYSFADSHALLVSYSWG